ncbi:Uma2 family endonuclease [Leptodesmis sichuanensis]|uniref:Uma2 family endonuclease n=1 Tax=Leptodesmis sichuanensis TaxID=2906798 RepID=UPI001F265BFA|nr:Uma2 family endonuclease [Leptodesmis sichuanensis]UIE39149.1 Uma2 family endonuclease [Leptodesmis sichuanensis A121]
MPQSPSLKSEIIYPESDGQPMADNTQQFNWIVYIKLGCEALFQKDPLVFVAGDLLWYPVEGNNSISTAPDIMVVFGRPKGDRSSYQQWQEDNIPPQVVFEVLSPSNRLVEMAKKFRFYERYGVEEYYLYDPEKADFSGWLRSQDFLEVIENPLGWVSPRLQVRFEVTDGQLEIYRPDGERFATYLELVQQVEQERQRANKLAAKLKELGVNPEDL